MENFNIVFTHETNYGSSAKQFYFVATEGMTIESKVPNQVRQIIQYAYNYHMQNDGQPFTIQTLCDFIDDNHEGTFTTSKGGTPRIVRYYSKMLQELGIISTEKPSDESDAE